MANRSLSPLLVVASIALLSSPARALTPLIDPDDDPRRPLITREETTPHELYRETSRRSPLWIAIDTTIGRGRDGIPTYGAMLLFGVPLDRVASRKIPIVHIAEGDKGDADRKPPPAPAPSQAPTPAPAKLAPPSPAKLAPAASGEKLAPIRLPVEVSPAVARGAVQAALERAKLVDPDARIDAIAARARSSALLPELRVRASRTVDDGQALSPTEYDPLRTTATSSVGLWLEARATWRLDRLVFSEEEVALERLRVQRVEAQTKIIERVLGLLFTWQRSMAIADDGAASPEEHLAATLKTVEAEVELDILTGGWFTKQRVLR